MNILFTCAGRRSYLLQYFKKELGGAGKIIAADMSETAPALQFSDKSYTVPGIYESNYIEEVLKICKLENVQALFSLNDLELPILSPFKNEFRNIGVDLIISSEEVIDICFDKWKTVSFCREHNIPTPKTYLDEKAFLQDLDHSSVSYPVVVKPRWGSASIGVDFPNSTNELLLSLTLQRIKIERSILSVASKNDSEYPVIIQEKMHGKEFGVDILNDFNGKVAKVAVKEKLSMRAGETDKSVMVDLPELTKLATILGNALGHIGNLDCDFFEKDGKYYLLEMNPRFGGGYPFTHSSGINYVSALISWLKGSEYAFESSKAAYGTIWAKCDMIIKV